MIAWLGWAACSANDDVPAPTISAVQPDHAVPGASVTVSGSFLCQAPRSGSDVDPLACDHVGTVLFGTTPSLAASYTDTAVVVEVPSLPPGPLDIAVSVAGRSSNSLPFVVD
jgi:IPT/TIG domain-containing protein